MLYVKLILATEQTFDRFIDRFFNCFAGFPAFCTNLRSKRLKLFVESSGHGRGNDLRIEFCEYYVKNLLSCGATTLFSYVLEVDFRQGR